MNKETLDKFHSFNKNRWELGAKRWAECADSRGIWRREKKKNCKARSLGVFFWLLTIILCPSLQQKAEAIIIRHDRKDSKYVKLAKPFKNYICHINLEEPGKAPDGEGTLIAPNWILTAAHVGTEVKIGHLVTVAGKNYAVEKVFLHPEWQDGGRHDIALLKLKTEVKNVDPVELYRKKDEVGQIITVVGRGDWGTGLTGPTKNDRKLRGGVNKIDEASEAWLKFVFDKPENALDLEGISGPGDSGGPAFLIEGKKTYLAGVGSGQSTTATGGREGVYGVTEYYVRVSSYLDWIESTIQAGNSNQTSRLPANFEKDLDEFAKKIQNDLKIQTGFAIGIVKNGELILQKRYGFLNVEKKTPLAEDTPFYIASTTKSFVGLLAVVLANKGFFKLDEPLSKYLPGLVFDDKKIQPDKITIRDLLNHTHGISNEVITFNTAYSGLNISDEKLLEGFKKESSYLGNNNFEYSNVGYVLAGLIIKKTTGKNWQENLKKYVLKPAGLINTSPYVSDFAKDKLPFAHYSFRREKGFSQTPFIKIDGTMHAAGGVLSTVADAAKWIIINQNKGKYEGKQLFPSKYFDETLRPQAEVKATFFNYERSEYGLGWYQAKLENYEMTHSFGGFMGARSHISFLPEQNIGVCVFINESGRGIYVPDLMANYAYGLLLNDENMISATENELAKQAKSYQEAIAKPPPEQPKIELSPEDVKNLAGNYSSETLGNLTVKIIGGKIFIELGNIKTFAEPVGKTEFETEFPYFYKFEFSENGITLNDGNQFTFAKNK